MKRTASDGDQGSWDACTVPSHRHTAPPCWPHQRLPPTATDVPMNPACTQPSQVDVHHPEALQCTWACSLRCDRSATCCRSASSCCCWSASWRSRASTRCCSTCVASSLAVPCSGTCCISALVKMSTTAMSLADAKSVRGVHGGLRLCRGTSPTALLAARLCMAHAPFQTECWNRSDKRCTSRALFWAASRSTRSCWHFASDAASRAASASRCVSASSYAHSCSCTPPTPGSDSVTHPVTWPSHRAHCDLREVPMRAASANR